MSRAAQSLTGTEKLRLEMIENEFNACSSTQTLSTREPSLTLKDAAVKANSAMSSKAIDYCTTSSSSSISSSSSSFSASSEWTTTTSSTVMLSETASEQPFSTAINSKSCCNTKELPSPITSKYAFDETTFLSSVLCNGCNSVLETVDTSNVSRNGNDKGKGINFDNENNVHAVTKTWLHSNCDSHVNGYSETCKHSRVNNEHERDTHENRDLIVDLSQDEEMSHVHAKNEIDTDTEEEDNASWAERQRATLIQMRIHFLPRTTESDKLENNIKILHEAKTSKRLLAFTKNLNDEETRTSVDKGVIKELALEGNICDSSNDISQTHSSLYTTNTTQPHVSNISGISPIKEEYASYITTESNNTNLSIHNDDNNNNNNTSSDALKINRESCSNKVWNEIEVDSSTEESSVKADVPEVKKMISELLEELRTRESSVKRTDMSFHIPGNDRHWHERVARRREQLQREVEEQKLHECTFHPSISPGSRAIATLRAQNELSASQLTVNNEWYHNSSMPESNVLANDKNDFPTTKVHIERKCEKDKEESEMRYKGVIGDKNNYSSNNYESVQRRSVYDRLYKIAETSKLHDSHIVHRERKDSSDNIDAWRKHCNGFVSTTSHISSTKAQNGNNNNTPNNNMNSCSGSVPSTAEGIIRQKEMRLFLSNVLDCEISENAKFDDLIRQQVAVRTKCVSPMAQAFAELKRNHTIPHSLYNKTLNNSKNVNSNSNYDNRHKDRDCSDKKEAFCEFWRRQERHLARKAQTVQVIKDEITPEFKPQTTHKSKAIIQRLLLEDENDNYNDAHSESSAEKLSECEQHVFASHNSVPVSENKNTLLKCQEQEEESMKLVKRGELHHEELSKRRNKRSKSTVFLNTEFIRQRWHGMRDVEETKKSCTFTPTLSKGTKRLLASGDRYKRSIQNYSECTNSTRDDASKENGVDSSNALNNNLMCNVENSKHTDKTHKNVSTALDDAMHNNIKDEIELEQYNKPEADKDLQNSKNVRDSTEGVTAKMGEKVDNVSSNKRSKSHKRFEELYAQHERVLRSREAARERSANEEVIHLTFTPRINNYNCFNTAQLSKRKSKTNIEEMSNIGEEEQQHVEKMQQEDVNSASRLKQVEQYQITSMLSKEKRKEYVQIITKRQQEREEKRAAMLREREKAELSQCTFKPQLTQLPEYIPRMKCSGESAGSVQQSANYCNLQRYRSEKGVNAILHTLKTMHTFNQ